MKLTNEITSVRTNEIISQYVRQYNMSVTVLTLVLSPMTHNQTYSSDTKLSRPETHPMRISYRGADPKAVPTFSIPVS